MKEQESHCCSVWGGVGRQEAVGISVMVLSGSLLEISLLVPGDFIRHSSLWKYPPKPSLTYYDTDLSAHQQTAEQRKWKDNKTTELINLNMHREGM